MPISGDKRDILSLQLISGIENFVRGLFLEKKISQSKISEVIDCKMLNCLAGNLGLKVRVKELVEEPIITTPKETPIEIINRIVTEVADNEPTNRLSSGIEVALTGDPIVIL